MPVKVDVQHDATAPRWRVAGPWLLLALLLGLAYWLLLNACGLRLLQGVPLLNFCRTPAAVAVLDPALAAERARQRALEAEIERLELALLRAPQCAPPAPPPVEAEAIPEDAWREQDVSFLEGCWDLVTDLQTTNVETGEVREVAGWQVCFDRAGSGEQTMRLSDGTTCSAPMQADFGDRDRLELSDRANVPCDDGGFMYERRMTCRRVDAAQAECVSRFIGIEWPESRSGFRRSSPR